MKAQALHLAEAGFRVFPLRARGKKPMPKFAWKDLACNDNGTVAGWWDKNPQCNIGLATGGRFFVIDVDNLEGWQQLLEANAGELPPCPTVLTGKGMHLYFAMPDGLSIGNRAGLAGGVFDIRGDGGYVVAPPSIHPDGRCYEWIEAADLVNLPQPPAWLLDLLKQPEPEDKPLDPLAHSTARMDKYVAAALAGVCNDVASAPEGQRNQTLYTKACRLFSFVQARKLAESVAIAALKDAARANGLQAGEVSATLASARKHAAQSPDDIALKDTQRPVLAARPAVGLPANDNYEVADVHDMPPVMLMSWPAVGEKGQPLNTIPNLRHLLNNYGFTVRYDVIRKDLVVRYPGQSGTDDNQRETAVNTIISLCALNRMPKADAPAFLLNIGDDNPVNPVMDFITSKPWDGRSRFGDLLATVQTRAGFDREWFAVLLRRWLLSAVAAAAKPSGFWSKGVLVFQGDQSLGKTAWFRALLPESMRELLKVDAHIDPDNKDSIISAVSHWLVELGELDGTLRKADIARLKGFISQDKDQFRRPYGRAEGKYQRRTIFFASVNPEQFLADDTGNVRWWTIPVSGINYQHGIDVQQLWAEVFELYQAGEAWWLTNEEETRLNASNAAYEQTDPVGELIQSTYGSASNNAVKRSMTATEVLLEIGFDRPTKAQMNEASKALRKLFGEPKRTKTARMFDVPVTAQRHPF